MSFCPIWEIPLPSAHFGHIHHCHVAKKSRTQTYLRSATKCGSCAIVFYVLFAESKVSQDNVALRIQQNVLWLQVPRAKEGKYTGEPMALNSYVYYKQWDFTSPYYTLQPTSHSFHRNHARVQTICSAYR